MYYYCGATIVVWLTCGTSQWIVFLQNAAAERAVRFAVIDPSPVQFYVTV